MFSFGQQSLDKLATCHPAVQAVATRAIELTPTDFTIVHGWRGEHDQTLLYNSGASKTRWPTSKHNHMEGGLACSLAIDFAPWIAGSIPWQDSHAFCIIAGVFFAAASERGVKIRYGGDWDLDGSTEDQTFMDWGHVEIIL